MIRAFSQRLLPPFSGQIQIVESDTFRALTLDSQLWEIQYVKRSHVRIGTLSADDIKSRSFSSDQLDRKVADPALVELLDYMADLKLPFPAIDHYEYWLLDSQDKAPLALIYACAEEQQMKKFPKRAEWTALPDAVMQVKKTDEEITSQLPPVNYRLESAVAERAGVNAKAAWFDRRQQDTTIFPSLLVREDWEHDSESELCQRYLDRQSPRLLMLQGLSKTERERLEKCCEPYAIEVARLCGAYPEVVNREFIRALQIEARLRSTGGEETQTNVHNRRDGILYI